MYSIPPWVDTPLLFNSLALHAKLSCFCRNVGPMLNSSRIPFLRDFECAPCEFPKSPRKRSKGQVTCGEKPVHPGSVGNVLTSARDFVSSEGQPWQQLLAYLLERR